jgi:hypothetical protein
MDAEYYGIMGCDAIRIGTLTKVSEENTDSVFRVVPLNFVTHASGH